MPYPEDDMEHLVQEHSVLLRHCGKLQQRCTAQIQSQVEEIAWLQAQAIRMRAQIIMLYSALAWEREDHLVLQARTALSIARHSGLTPMSPTPDGTAKNQVGEDLACDANLEQLEYSLRAADLVICQTGCVSHGAFWRVQDHCKRTGKTCVLMEQPEAMRIVRIHPADLAAAQTAEPLAVKETS